MQHELNRDLILLSNPRCWSVPRLTSAAIKDYLELVRMSNEHLASLQQYHEMQRKKKIMERKNQEPKMVDWATQSGTACKTLNFGTTVSPRAAARAVSPPAVSPPAPTIEPVQNGKAAASGETKELSAEVWSLHLYELSEKPALSVSKDVEKWRQETALQHSKMRERQSAFQEKFLQKMDDLTNAFAEIASAPAAPGSLWGAACSVVNAAPARQ
eukprot:gnl/TRDRNA2_/TRDRNA2_171740_c1_seq3.p1 gnl/TRDRNA2_/TRDRNA2_171740_c1~~gnl/TRDRNA2_/TRDRNA2_171740_c1_seq3.p1  ORF type:complete len:214 (+),score=54.65 gnl/TRDRNA2_/TRDRNA2_171740_c1_seq3:658-1299(+)